MKEPIEQTIIAIIGKLIDGLQLEQFYDGRQGLCLQLVPKAGYYAQLTQTQVRELIAQLLDWLGERDLPFKQPQPRAEVVEVVEAIMKKFNLGHSPLTKPWLIEQISRVKRKIEPERVFSGHPSVRAHSSRT